MQLKVSGQSATEFYITVLNMQVFFSMNSNDEIAFQLALMRTTKAFEKKSLLL